MADPISTAEYQSIITSGGERATVYTPEMTAKLQTYTAQTPVQTLEADNPGITTKTYATMQEDPLYGQLNTLIQQGGGAEKYNQIDAIADVLVAKYPGSDLKERLRQNVTSSSGVTAADIARETYGGALTSQKAASGDVGAQAAISSGAWTPGTEKAATAAAEIGISPVVSSNPAINSNPVVNTSEVYNIGDMSPKSGMVWSGTGWTNVANVPGAQVAMVRAGFNPLASSLGESYYNVMTNSINEKAGRYYGNELQKSLQNYVELSSAYHNWAKDTGLPTAPNSYEYAGDLALGILKGTNQSSKSSVYGENITDYSTLNLPGGLGIQDVAWNAALAYDKASGWKADYSGYDTAIAKLQNAVANKELGVYGAIPAPTSTQAGGETRKLSLGEQQAIGIAASGSSYTPENLRNPYVETGTLLGFGAKNNAEAASNLYQKPYLSGSVARSAVASPLEELGDTGLYMVPGTLAKATTPTSVELTKSYSYDLPILGTVASGETALGIHNFLASNPVLSVLGTPLTSFERTNSIINIVGQPVKETVTLNAPDTKSAGAQYTGRFLNEYTGAVEPVGTSKEFLNYPITTDIKVGESAFGKGSRYVSEVSQYILPSVSSLSPAAETLAQKGDVLKYVPVMGLALSGASKIPAIGFGAYTGIREKPVETGINVGVGIALGGIFDAALGVSGYAIGTTAEGTTARKVTSTLGSAFNVGTKYVLPGLYAADVGIRSEGSYTKLGGILGTETGPMIVGGGIYSGLKSVEIPSMGRAKQSVTDKIFDIRQGLSGVERLEPMSGLEYLSEGGTGPKKSIIPLVFESTQSNVNYKVDISKVKVPDYGDILVQRETRIVNLGKSGAISQSSNVETFGINMDQYKAITGVDIGGGSFGRTTVTKYTTFTDIYPSGKAYTYNVGTRGTVASDVGIYSQLKELNYKDVLPVYEDILKAPARARPISKAPYSGEDFASSVGIYSRASAKNAPETFKVPGALTKNLESVIRVPKSEALVLKRGTTTESAFPGSSDITEYLRNPQMTKEALGRGLLEVGTRKTTNKIGSAKYESSMMIPGESGNLLTPTKEIAKLSFGEGKNPVLETANLLESSTIPRSGYEINRIKSIAKAHAEKYYPQLLGMETKRAARNPNAGPMTNLWAQKSTARPVSRSAKPSSPLAKLMATEEAKINSIYSDIEMASSAPRQESGIPTLSNNYLAPSKVNLGWGNRRVNVPLEEEEVIYTGQVPGMRRPSAEKSNTKSVGMLSGLNLFSDIGRSLKSGKTKEGGKDIESVPSLGLGLTTIPALTNVLKTNQVIDTTQITEPARTTKPAQITRPIIDQIVRNIPDTRTTTKPKPTETKLPVVPIPPSWTPGGGVSSSGTGRGKKYREIFSYNFAWEKSTNVGAAAKPQKVKPSTSKPSMGMSLPKMGEGLMGPQKSVVQISNPSKALKSSIPKSLMSPPSQSIGKSSTVIAKKKKGKK